MKAKTWMLLVLCASVAACAGSGARKRERDETTLARYVDNSGEPVEQFSYLGRFDSWRALGRDKIVVWTGVNDAYLLTVQTPCSELPFANSIGLTSTTGTVHRGFDSVRFGRNEQCRIMEIRPVDYKKVRQIERDGG